MRSRLTAVVLFLVAFAVFADEQPRDFADRGGRERLAGARHFLLEPQRALTDADRAALEAEGVSVLRPMANGRFLVRIAAGSVIDASDPRVRSLEALTAQKKMQASAYRAAAQGRTFASLNVIFNDDVSFEDARAAVEDAGGALDDVLAVDFLPPQRLRARVPSANVMTLAGDERVLTVYGGAQYRGKTHNAFQEGIANVAALQSAPYNLDGAGLVLSYFELGPGDAAHREFGGRLVNEYTCKAVDDSCKDLSNQAHATHTAGTMIASGLDPESKGVAPAATLHGYRALCGSQTECGPNAAPDWLAIKERTLKSIGAVTDNNSWGVILGWNRETNGQWTWYGFDEAIGGYEFTTAALDKAARVNGTLMVHSAGNEALVFGPQSAPFAHNHVDDQFKIIAGETFCYSSDGSGTDCPTQCTATPGHCETVRHPTHTPYGSVGLLASPKNILTVGATDSARNIATFSSRGPTRDGRVKPEIVAPGTVVRSSLPNNLYGNESGTSMSSPLVAGTAALLFQLWQRTFNAAATPAAIKTLLLAGADDVGNPGPDYTYGFGFLNGKASADLVVADGGTGKRIRIDSLSQGGQFEVPMTITSTQNLRTVLGWADPEVLVLGDEFVDKTLVNDLDLKVIDPNGATVLPYVLDKSQPTVPATRGVNTTDNTEEVEIVNAVPGVYRLIVSGTRVVSPQQFVLIGNGEVGTAVPPCIDANEPNDSPQSIGYLPSGQTATGKICSANDVDYFKIRTNSTDLIRVTVTAGDTPLRVSLSSAFVTPATMDVPANGTNSFSTLIQILIAPTPTTDAVIKIEPIGTVGADAAYTITTTYTYKLPPRRRATRG